MEFEEMISRQAASVEQDALYFVFPNTAYAEGELSLETTKLKERAFGNKLRGAS
jgi:hypothetical protein